MPQKPTIPGETVGAVIYRTVRYVERTLLDVHAVMNVAENHMAERGWWPLKGDKLIDPADANSFKQPEWWIMKTVGRAYVNIPKQKSLEPVDQVRIVEVHLVPEFASEAMVVLAMAHLSTRTHRRGIWNSWLAFVGEVLESAIPRREPFVLEDARVKRAMSIADQITVRVLSLTDVSSQAQVLDRIVAPLLELS